jgi:hypothetical protein
MNKQEIKSALAKVTKLKTKVSALRQEVDIKTREVKDSLSQLAKKTCPYKKGQIFKKSGAVVWAKVISYGGLSEHHRITESDYAAPYVLECHRCTVKGVTQKDKWIFIEGSEIGKEWTLVEETEKEG